MAWKEYSFKLPEFLFATVPEIDGSFKAYPIVAKTNVIVRYYRISGQTY